jgi:hypothetical protein
MLRFENLMIWQDEELFPPVLLDFSVITKYFNHISAHSTFYLNDEIGFLMRATAAGLA